MDRFNHESRTRLEQNYRIRFDKKNRLQILLLDSSSKTILSEQRKFASIDGRTSQLISEAIHKMDSGTYRTPSEFMKKHYKKVVDIFVSKDDRQGFYHIIDKYNKFQYSVGANRRSIRSHKYGPHMANVFRLLTSYYSFGIYECSIRQYLLNDMAEDKLDYKKNALYSGKMRNLDDMIAAEIDLGKTSLIEAIQDIILNENNTHVVTVELIRGIIKSSNDGLHKLLGDLLLAARLQEGVRQAICENADCGTVEAFLRIFHVICDNNLIRFSSVKRAVATWIGICDENNLERISNKLLLLMKDSLNDKKRTLELTESNDSIEIMVALWSLGLYEVEEAIKVMNRYVTNGSKNQKLTMSYYNQSLDYGDFSEITAKKMMEEHHKDFEMVAAFIPSYLSEVDNYVFQVVHRNSDDATTLYKRVPLSYLFHGVEEADRHFNLLKIIYEGLPKKRLDFSPCIFPWYSLYLSKTQLIKRMCLIAYSVGDQTMIDYAASLLSLIDTMENYSNRAHYLEMLLHNPQTAYQKELLVKYIADKETDTRKRAYTIVHKLNLEDNHYRLLEEMLRYKLNDIRENVIKLLLNQRAEVIISSVTRLLNTKKEEVRTAGLDLLMQMKEIPELKKDYFECVKLVKSIEHPTAKEKILIDEICGVSNASKILNEKGYGLYDPDQQVSLKEIQCNPNILKEYFDIPASLLHTIFDRLTDYLEEHKNLEYTDASGEECLLGNGIAVTKYGCDIQFEDRMPFKELWCEFYHNEIKNYKTLLNLYMVLEKGNRSIKQQDVLRRNEAIIIGKDTINCNLADNQFLQSGKYRVNSIYHDVIQILICIYEERSARRELAKAAFKLLIDEISKDKLWYDSDLIYFQGRIPFTDTGEMEYFKQCLDEWKTEEEFTDMFHIYYRVDALFQLNMVKQNSDKMLVEYEYNNFLSILDYIKAYGLQLISANEVYKAMFETIGLQSSLSALSIFYKIKLTQYDKKQLQRYGIDDDTDLKTHPLYQNSSYFYQSVVDKVLEVELKRGDTATVFSSAIHRITCIYGMEYLIEILKALGTDSLDRSSYYWSSDTSKKSCLSHLLKVCYPMLDDSAEKMSRLVIGSGISEQRLIETAMYAPQWIDIIGEYLGIQGFKSGCFYFMAHMNEHFDDMKKAMVAVYTPIDPEKLYQGAFDLNWFKEAFDLLGEDNFNKIYDASKYSSDGSKHTRARKYADATLGRITSSELEKAIDEKRNKDLLMSYCLVPIACKEDIFHRYQYLQRFLKESKQFGAQRRASESAAVDIAMENLAMAADFSDVTRLTLIAESELIKSAISYLDWKELDGIFVRLVIDEVGQTSIEYKKNEKLLSSAPSALKNHEYIVSIKEIRKKLMDQSSRTKQMFEIAMECKTIFSISELIPLLENPVIAPIISNLVLISEENDTVKIGFLKKNGLSDYNGIEVKVDETTEVRVAHSYDLYKYECWHEYQKYFFDRKHVDCNKKQAFKQVFRELYIKIEEELDKKQSIMFAGHQIQPQKTVGCLKNRRWIANYSEGLQKVYYKDNIVANIYAMTDWFSPSDIEAPTLEGVIFYDRKTFKTLTIGEIPDIIYSEVMRDVDLAVSVAHVGGVDPETSHSTIDMRKAIIEFNLPLFELDNVTLEGRHALIKGKRAEYNIHLGSAMVHKAGGPLINVLAVHSQSRGKLFLPFIDEDPKTAEIMSKIVLFARDEKIKDPYTLNQL